MYIQVRHLIHMSTGNDLGRDCGLNRRRMTIHCFASIHKREFSALLNVQYCYPPRISLKHRYHQNNMVHLHLALKMLNCILLYSFDKIFLLQSMCYWYGFWKNCVQWDIAIVISSFNSWFILLWIIQKSV